MDITEGEFDWSNQFIAFTFFLIHVVSYGFPSPNGILTSCVLLHSSLPRPPILQRFMIGRHSCSHNYRSLGSNSVRLRAVVGVDNVLPTPAPTPTPAKSRLRLTLAPGSTPATQLCSEVPTQMEFPVCGSIFHPSPTSTPRALFRPWPPFTDRVSLP